MRDGRADRKERTHPWNSRLTDRRTWRVQACRSGVAAVAGEAFVNKTG